MARNVLVPAPCGLLNKFKHMLTISASIFLMPDRRNSSVRYFDR